MKSFKLFALLLLTPILVYAGYAEIGSQPQLGPSRKACTITASASANMTLKNVFCWQIGDTLRIDGEMNFTGAPGSGSIWRIQIPSGFTINTAKLPNGSATSGGEASRTGFCTAWDDADVGYRVLCPVFYDTGGTQNQIKFVIGGGDLLDNAIANNDSINFSIEVPVW